jgi:hypothetical protein
MLAYIHKQAFLLSTFGAYDNQRLPYACLLSTKGAYYVANKQAQIKRQLRTRTPSLSGLASSPSISPSLLRKR